MTEPRQCWVCRTPCGTRLVCAPCQKHLTASEHRRLTLLWHEVVVAKGYDPVKDRYRCFHCGEWFERDMVAGDHFPVTKGSCEAVRFDVAAGQPSCSACNSGVNNRRNESMKAHPRYDLCRECGFLLAVKDGRCYRCVQKPATNGHRPGNKKIGRGV